MVKEELPRDITKESRLNENKNTSYQNLWDAMKKQCLEGNL